MHAKQFQGFLENLHKLSPAQVKKLRAALEKNDAVLRTYSAMQEATGGLCCHHCSSKKVVKNGFENGLQRLRCKECGRSSNCATGTPLSRLRNKEKFATYAHCLEQGMTLRQAAQATQLNLDRAFRWRHRFLQTASVQNPTINSSMHFAQAEAVVHFKLVSNGEQKLADKLDKSNSLTKQVAANQKSIEACVSVPALNPILSALRASAQAREVFAGRSEGVFDQAKFFTLSGLDPSYKPSYAPTFAMSAACTAIENVNYVNVWPMQDWLQRKLRGVGNKYLPNYLAWQRMRTWHEEGMSAEQILQNALGKAFINV